MAQRVVVRKKKATPKFDPADLVETFRRWAHVKGDEERAKAIKEGLRTDRLFPVLEAHGEEDDKGSLILVFPEAVTINTLNADGVKKATTYTGLKKEKRPRFELQEDKAEAWLEKNGLLEQVQVTVETKSWSWDFNQSKMVLEKTEDIRLNQDALYLLNQEGKIPDKTLDSFFEEKITWALVPIKA